MRYSKFTIQNFKGIKNLTLTLDSHTSPKVFTLVGLNESGKTSILEAINLFQEKVNPNDSFKLIPKSERINFNDEVSISAKIVLSDFDNERISNFSKSLGYIKFKEITHITIEKVYSFEKSNFDFSTSRWTVDFMAKKKNGKVFKEIQYEKNIESDWQKVVKFIKDYLLPTILYYPNFLFDFPEKIYIDNLVANNSENIGYKDVVQDILYSIDKNLTIQDHLLDRLMSDQQSDKEALEHTLLQMSSSVSTKVFTSWEKLFSSRGKEIVIKSGSTKDGEVVRYYLELKLKEGASTYSISERSLGFKWFFTFLLFTEFRKNRVTDTSEILFLLDEPASNLHSTAQKNLLSTFKELIFKSTLIYTTHSHHLINPEWLNGVYIVRNRNLDYNDELNYDNSNTDIEAVPYKKFVASHPDQQDYFQPILDALEYQPGLLEKIPSIIITEGKSDYYTFKYILRTFFFTEFQLLNFFPGNGANANHNVIALYLAWNRKIYILLDSDSGGKDARKKYIQYFGKEVESLVYTYNEIDETLDKISIEWMFNEKEREAISKICNPDIIGFDKGSFNISIQSLLHEKRKIDLSHETLGKFRKVFHHFNDLLSSNIYE